MKSKRILPCLLAASLLFFPPAKNQATASSVISTVVGSSVVSIVPIIFYNLICSLENRQREITGKEEMRRVGGFREPKEILNKLDDIDKGNSKIKIYGQEKAKKQLRGVFGGIVTRLDNMARGRVDKKDFRGNVVYFIGPSGTGKTTMAYAIADAFLKHPEKTFLSYSSDSVSGDTDLGSQLFKTIITKNIGQKRELSSAFEQSSLTPKEEESPILQHILKWGEGCVVFIDEFDKMKLLTKNSVTEIKCDKSADEILRSIQSNGGYAFIGGKWIDCSKVLFFVATNETREELESNFGISGIKGGGAQRLNIVEFEELSIDACRHIVDDIIQGVGETLVDADGLYQLASVNIDNDSVENMAQYIFDDKIMQGRAKYVLENEIYSLFSGTIGADCEKNIKLSCNYSSEDHTIEFTKTIVDSCDDTGPSSHDFSDDCHTVKLCDQLPVTTSLPQAIAVD